MAEKKSSGSGARTASDYVESYEDVRKGMGPGSSKRYIFISTIIVILVGGCFAIWWKKHLDLYGILISAFGAFEIAKGSVVGYKMNEFLHSVIASKIDLEASYLTQEEIAKYLLEYNAWKNAGVPNNEIVDRLTKLSSKSKSAKQDSFMLSQRDLAFLFLDVSAKTLYGTILVGLGSATAIAAIMITN